MWVIVFPFQVGGLIFIFLKIPFLSPWFLVVKFCKIVKKGSLKGFCNFRVAIYIWLDFNHHLN